MIGTEVIFETATLADAIKKAEKVAPTSGGSVFNKCGGIVMDIEEDSIMVRTTNLDIFRIEQIDSVEITNPASTWRFPSRLFAQVLSSLPIGSNSQVTLTERQKGMQSNIALKCGRIQATFNMLDPELFPVWDSFDPADLTETIDLGGRIEQVEWSAAKGEAPLAGVHLNGEYAIATDKYRLARVPLPIPGLTEPITIPAGILSTLLKQSGELKVGVNGGQFLVMPDDYTQIRCILYGVPYPGLTKILDPDRPSYVTVRKELFLAMVQRAASFGASDRDAPLRVYIGEEEIAVRMANQEVGLIGDALEIPGQCTHPRHEIRFTAKNLIEAVTHAPSDEITLGYDTARDTTIVYIDGGSGYQTWVVPRAKIKTGE